ncbi:MAG: hypothetical protein ACLRSD_18100 [Oscillibacter sp.]
MQADIGMACTALRPNVPVVHFNQEFMAINGRVIIGGFVAAINDIRLDKIVGLCDIIDCEIDISAAVLLCVKGVKVLADVITFASDTTKDQLASGTPNHNARSPIPNQR